MEIEECGIYKKDIYSHKKKSMVTSENSIKAIGISSIWAYKLCTKG